MKKLLCLTLAIGFCILGLSMPQHLAAAPSPTPGVGSVCGVTGSTSTTFCQDQTGTNRISGPSGVIITGANILSIVAGIASIIIITVGALQYILSGGDSSKVNSAKNMIIYALVGLVVIVMAQTIIRFILSKL